MKKEINFRSIKDQLPPMIARDQIGVLLGGVISPKYLANLDSQGLGPDKMRMGRKVVYMTEDLLSWLEARTEVIVNTIKEMN